jgi:hypothetical protein
MEGVRFRGVFPIPFAPKIPNRPMVTLRAITAAAALVVAGFGVGSVAAAAVPDYKLGDVAEADIITPVPLVVLNPEATEVLKQKVAQQVQFIVLQTTETTAEAEAALREKVAAARMTFMTALRREDLDAPPYSRVIQEIAKKVPKELPFDQLAPLWVRGQKDDEVVERMLQAVREVMTQPIVRSKTDTPLPTNQPVRVVTVKSLTPAPGVKDVENAGQLMPSARVISLWRARQLVEAAFPAGQESLGKFAATFLRPNANPEPNLTELLRAQRTEGVAANDSYAAAQVIVRKGQTIDRKALSVLAVMREKSLIGTLQVKLEQEQTVAGQIRRQTTWIAVGLSAMCAILLLVLWRVRARPATTLSPVLINPGLNGGDAQALPSGADDAAWRSRALAAEGKAERAHQAIRSGVMGWMREKLFRNLFRQREALLSSQQKAEIEIRELEQRLEELHAPLQERITAYEQRIEELERDLAARGEENRELIGARINVTKQHLQVERERERGEFAGS